MNIWRSIEQEVDEKFTVKVLFDNINLILAERDIDYVNSPFMNMFHMLIAK